MGGSNGRYLFMKKTANGGICDVHTIQGQKIVSKAFRNSDTYGIQRFVKDYLTY